MDDTAMIAHRLTRGEQNILNMAMRESIKIISGENGGGDMQDGILAYYLSQAKASDVNVEARIEKEPFDFRELTK